MIVVVIAVYVIMWRNVYLKCNKIEKIYNDEVLRFGAELHGIDIFPYFSSFIANDVLFFLITALFCALVVIFRNVTLMHIIKIIFILIVTIKLLSTFRRLDLYKKIPTESRNLTKLFPAYRIALIIHTLYIIYLLIFYVAFSAYFI